MQHLGYLWAACTVVWGGTLVYVGYLVRHQRRLEAELDRLQALVQRLEETAPGSRGTGDPATD
ncbi:CcmD family protein [Alicyclobacillus sp.]|uniref:CcmD family protein n=1 Tax=Alicyclobacillus sp. TaxID=61169 RepID=UPI0025BFD64D|nr:CcmD family protein [Alicyclobacillus sp.]MCL6515804.1 CcmD family protein [Alicyclobacillus sp.]